MHHLSGFLFEFRVCVFLIKTDLKLQLMVPKSSTHHNYRWVMLHVGTLFTSPNTFWWNINLSNVADCSQFVSRHTLQPAHTLTTQWVHSLLSSLRLLSLLCSCYRTTNAGEVQQLSVGRKHFCKSESLSTLTFFPWSRETKSGRNCKGG